MADKKLSALPIATNVDNNDLVYVVQSGESKQALAEKLPFVKRSGDTMTGNLDMGFNSIQLSNGVELESDSFGGEIGLFDVSQDKSIAIKNQSTGNFEYGGEPGQGVITIDNSNDNVGINNSNPTEQLDLMGNAKILGKIALNDGGNSVFIGTRAGLNDDGSDNNNVGVGHEALRDNTTGPGNTAVGYGSLMIGY